MKAKELKYIAISDIHLGHRRVPTSHIANNIRKHVLTPENSDIDILFINGDLFDRLLEPDTREFIEVLYLVNSILTYCRQHNIKLRLLDGTPFHEANQLPIIEAINNSTPKRFRHTDTKVDLKIHESLDIEYFPEEDIHVLYIPDEWTHDHDLLEKQIKEKLNQYSISQVDMCMLHSCFQYQVAGLPYKGFSYKEDFFLSITKKLIHIGHFHTFTTFDRIIANGSFDRLRHNEEEDKGYVKVSGDSWKFIKNPDAYTFKTLNLTKNSTINSLDKAISTLPKGAYVRLRMSSDHPFNLNFRELRLKYLDYNLEKQIKDVDETGQEIRDVLSDTELEVVDGFIIDTDIKGTLLKIIDEKYELTPSEEVLLGEYVKVFDNLEVVEE